MQSALVLHGGPGGVIMRGPNVDLVAAGVSALLQLSCFSRCFSGTLVFVGVVLGFFFDGVRGYFSSYRPQQQQQIAEREPPAHAVEVSYTEPAAKKAAAKKKKKGKAAH